ncbi:MAG: PSD1 and planctomycete cytochrome C domain-containing protein [Rhodothermales bacterium]
MPRIRILFSALVLLVVGGIWWYARPGTAEVDFNHDVRPILNEKCVVCHGGVRREAELSLLFRDDALQPAESGAHAIVPGDPGRSELIRRVTHANPDERMPLDQPALSDHEVDVLQAWIDRGAPWEPHWAYVPPERTGLPDVSDPSWPRTAIDHFVMARLDEAGLDPSPQAECEVLLRRVSLDLIGLPPTPEETANVCANPPAADPTGAQAAPSDPTGVHAAPSDAAYEAVVDRLLDSPRFGERWAAYWLDLARYADTNGYEKDTPRSIWTYRDWVIRAFNDDVPFDRFSTEQLAGDLLEDPDPDQLIATAFHRNSMTNTEGGTDDEEFRLAAVIDRLNTTFEVWQGTTIACAQCHGHPYDPIRHEEFYELLAFFNNTADTDQPDNEPKLYQFDERPFNENAERGQALLAERDELERQAHDAVNDDSLAAWTDRLEAYARDGNRPPRFEGRTVVPHVVRIARKEASKRDPFERHLLRELFVESRPEFESFRERRSKLDEAIAALEPVTTPVMQELPPSASRATRVFERGNWLAHGERVEPGVPESLPPMPEGAPSNRLGLAQWLFAPDNPLTARVAVNRFWEQLFGRGLVETAEDLGTQGASPTHPELLDALALQFSNDFEWSVKRLLKGLVTSATYRQASRVSPELLEIDPENRLLARGPRFRLSAEQVRDQALAVSGLLSDAMYGPSVFPPQPPGLWNNPYSSLRWETSDGEDRYRRAVYTYWRRTVPHPALLAFDAPSRELCVSRRIRTNTPLQSLVTLNDPAFVEAAVALSERMHLAAVDAGADQRADRTPGAASIVDVRLRRGYRLALQRDPSPDVLRSLRELYDEALDAYRTDPESAAALLNVKQNAFAEYGAEEYEDGYEDGSGEPASAARALIVDGADLPDTPDRAALAVTANAILNVDAFLTKE